MKWFHHECTAKHDPKLQTLGATFGAEGLGIFWGLLEEIGQHSDTFQLRISGISKIADDRFSITLAEDTANSSRIRSMLCITPCFPRNILAKVLFTTPTKLTRTIELAVELGLFDKITWQQFAILYSPSFERRADEYTRRRHRRPETVQRNSGETSDNVRTLSGQTPNTIRTESEHSPNTVRTKSDKVPLETEEEVEVEEKKNRSRRERSLLLCSVSGKTQLSTHHPQDTAENSSALIQLTKQEFERYSRSCHDAIRQWNEDHPARFDWQPTELELKKLFYGGQRRHKINLCYQAINVQGGEVRYADLILRAIRLMLKASERQRITNPFGWLWTCLHGNGDGTSPWVQLLTASEEAVGPYKPP